MAKCIEQEPKEQYIWWPPVTKNIRNFRSTRIQLTERTGSNDWTLPPRVQSTTERSKTPQVMTGRVWCLMIGRKTESGRSWHLLLRLTGRRAIFTPDARGTLFSVRSLLCYICSPPMNWPNAESRVWCSIRSPFFSKSSKFLHTAFSQSSPNFNKTQINTNWDWFVRPLSNPQIFQNILP